MTCKLEDRYIDSLEDFWRLQGAHCPLRFQRYLQPSVDDAVVAIFSEYDMESWRDEQGHWIISRRRERDFPELNDIRMGMGESHGLFVVGWANYLPGPRPEVLPWM